MLLYWRIELYNDVYFAYLMFPHSPVIEFFPVIYHVKDFYQNLTYHITQ